MTAGNYLEEKRFFGLSDPEQLIRQFGSPLYVYNEAILRQSCRDMQSIIDYPDYTANYSTKANANVSLLRIVRDEGLFADAMSPGEIMALEEAGFKSEQIFFVPNNVSSDEMRFALDRSIMISLDSIAQLEQLGSIAPGTSVALRVNPGLGIGHHAKVVTAGKKTKFGISANQVEEAKAMAERYHLRVSGINQHVGSLFMEPADFLKASQHFFDIAIQFKDLDLVDLGGGFGIPYRKMSGEKHLDIAALRSGLTEQVMDFMRRYGRNITVKTEPGRYIVAESGVLLGTIHALKQNDGVTYVGTDIGFNVLARPVLYDSWHDLLAYRDGKVIDEKKTYPVTVVGNICESGDMIAAKRRLPHLERGDILAVMDAGAYGYSMSSNYNNRLRPAEVLIGSDGKPRLIRRRETFDDLLRTLREIE